MANLVRDQQPDEREIKERERKERERERDLRVDRVHNVNYEL